MTADEAIAVVRDERVALNIEPEMAIAAAERAFVPCVPGDARTAPVVQRVAWVVTVSNEWGFAEVHVDEATGKVLDVVRSL